MFSQQSQNTEFVSYRCNSQQNSQYRVFQEEMSILREVTVEVIIGEKVHKNVCSVLNGYEAMAVGISTVTVNKEIKLLPNT
jgi:hypothetical protein